MADYLFIAGLVFLLNALPALTPPTWLVLSFFHSQDMNSSILLLAVLGAVASTLGRIVLAKYSGFFLQFIKNKALQENSQFVRDTIDKGAFGKFIFAFLYSLSPLPSNNLFIIAGASKLHLVSIAGGFLIGRFISYAILIKFLSPAIGSLSDIFSELSGLQQLALEALSVVTVILFFLIDWKSLVQEKKFRLIKVW